MLKMLWSMLDFALTTLSNCVITSSMTNQKKRTLHMFKFAWKVIRKTFHSSKSNESRPKKAKIQQT
jgi:hypothetical protein